MAQHAPLLKDNLAAGADDAGLAETEKTLGFALPHELRELWAIHDGQVEAANPFYGSLNFLSCTTSLDDRDYVMESIESLRDDPSLWKEAGVTKKEIASDDWIPLAQTDADGLVVSGQSGRVFVFAKDAPPLSLLAASIGEWLSGYADALECGDYRLEKGFGGMFLECVREA